MLADRLKLTAKEILEKEFKTKFRGYKQDEVDQFLDQIIKDYEAMHQVVEELQQENIKLKKQVGEQSRRQPPAQPAGTTNFDILKRLSNLEKHVFGSKLDE
ncbi:cell division regulator GpsB [Lederbergia galactosidilytica]|uniref:Cell cycle protein GpsB n=1 Tax=Lederbergia galactosidilytica TaxID=217031 RepID=A0A177ZP99_9BACI|nr:cell division regulator GpsB [Lederbergia galactosidilytica]KRG12476.1 cell division protein DivIVA [Virgibacillus soli]MBP1914594.1 DivIVA domain-containing protein [Lederbergia galactosidilytica]OAK69811.1 cell division protein DivIVA [Lederbergia galactosidilytica]